MEPQPPAKRLDADPAVRVVLPDPRARAEGGQDDAEIGLLDERVRVAVALLVAQLGPDLRGLYRQVEGEYAPGQLLGSPLPASAGRSRRVRGVRRYFGHVETSSLERRCVRPVRCIGADPGDQSPSNSSRFTSPIAPITSMPRGHASVQLRIVRQRQTP